MPTAAPNKRTPEVCSNRLPGDAAAVPDGGHISSHEPTSELHERGDRSGGAAAETAASVSAMMVVTAEFMIHERGYGCESRAQTGVSICVCADGSTSRDVHVWAGGGGAPSLASSLLPLRKVLRAHRWGWDAST